MKLIRILLVDDQASVRRGIAMRLQLEPDLQVVGEADDGSAALLATETLLPDVLVMDYEMPGMNGIEAARQLSERGFDARVVMLSIHDDSALKQAAAQAGIRAFVAKHEASEALLMAIRQAATSGDEEGSF